MIFTDGSTHYDVLDTAPDASPQEIRAAYLRVKGAYHPGSVATYSLMGADDTDEMLARIEEAYRVLSSPEQRKEYDRSHGFLLVDEDRLRRPGPPRNQKIVSIDRVPPMAMDSSDPDMLVSPPTDFGSNAGRGSNERPAASGSDLFSTTEAPMTSISQPFSRQSAEPGWGNAKEVARPQPAATPAAVAPPMFTSRTPAPTHHDDPTLIQEMAVEQEWHGHFLKKIREARHIAFEEVADFTKVSKTYILAIEEETFAKLPAAVFVRGFVTQYAKMLKLPHEKVVAGFMSRYLKARPGK